MKTKIYVLTILTILGLSSLARAEMTSLVNLPIAFAPPPVYTVEGCGDGVIQSDLGETCEDGNKVNGDGCDSECHSEIITVAPPPPINLVSGGYCGDGIRQEDLLEECDDGNKIVGDGCNNDCHVELPPPAVYEPPMEEAPPPAKTPEKTVTPIAEDPSDDPSFIGVGVSGSGACSLQTSPSGIQDLGFGMILLAGLWMFTARRKQA